MKKPWPLESKFLFPNLSDGRLSPEAVQDLANNHVASARAKCSALAQKCLTPHGLPTRGAVLVVTDEQGCETTFGFVQYADAEKDIHGRTLAETELAGRWHFSEFADSPEARFREIVRLFAASGFVEREKDEFGPTTKT
jgi:hypothetical protein